MHCSFDFSRGEGERVHKQKKGEKLHGQFLLVFLQKLVEIGFRIRCSASELLNIHEQIVGYSPNFLQGAYPCRELPLCAGSGKGYQWQVLPSPVQCEETMTYPGPSGHRR